MTSFIEAGLAAVVHRFGPPEVIRIERVGTPPPGPGEVRLRVQAAGVGSWDAQVRSGKGSTPQSLPLVLGGDLAGVVESVGPGVVAVGVGDVVFGVTNSQLTGACAELALAEAARILCPTHDAHLDRGRGGPGRRLHRAPDHRDRRHLGRDADARARCQWERRSVDDSARSAPRRRGGGGRARFRIGRGASARGTPGAHLPSRPDSGVRPGARHGGGRVGQLVPPSAPTGRPAGIFGAKHRTRVIRAPRHLRPILRGEGHLGSPRASCPDGSTEVDFRWHSGKCCRSGTQFLRTGSSRASSRRPRAISSSGSPTDAPWQGRGTSCRPYVRPI